MPGKQGGEIGKREAAIVIAVFAIGLAAFCVSYVRTQLATENVRLKSLKGAAAPAAQRPASGSFERRTSDDYQIIGKRNIFAPRKEAKAKAPVAGKSLSPAPSKSSLPPLPSPFGSFPGRRFDTSRFGGGGSSTGITATGIVRLDGVPYALIEKTDGSDSTLAKVGDTAFGHTVVSMIGDQVTVRGPQGIVTLKLGEGKQEKAEKAPEPSKSGESGDKSKSGGEEGKTEKPPTAGGPPPAAGAGDMKAIWEMRRSRGGG